MLLNGEAVGEETDGRGGESPLHKTTISALTPLGARKDAQRLLAAGKRRGGNIARVLNAQGETVFWIDE